MSKPLTIEELKAMPPGSWVWIKSQNNGGRYYQKCKDFANGFIPYVDRISIRFDYSIYGESWLAYKNKEQAEAKGEIVELPCKVGDTVWVINAWMDYGDTTKGESYYATRYELVEGKAIGFEIYGNDCRIMQNAPKHGVQPYVFTSKVQAEARLKELKGESV